jgi:uncharacterized protein (TIGR03790 family)
VTKERALALAFLRRFVFWLCLVNALGSGAAWALDPSEVLILVNKDSGISSQVAEMYRKLRGVPEGNVLRLSLGSNRQISAQEYRDKTASAVKRVLDARPEIRCILTTAGVPYVIGTPENSQAASYDSQLATVLREPPGDLKWRQPNPLFVQGGNPFGLTDPRRFQMVLVVRLDGPNLNMITRMVEDAIAVEAGGLQGPVFGDARGIDGIGGEGLGDYQIRSGIDVLSGAGFVSTLDMKPESWTQPKGGVGNQAAGAAFYVGWYNLADFQDIFGAEGLARGAIAWHIASQEAQDIWNLNSHFWCVNLLRRGAAVTLGPAFEPYLDAFPPGGVLMQGLLSGLTVAESYWLALPKVSWAMVILGDPLYRPFAAHPKPALLAQAYIKEGGNHVLQSGETAPLLVLVHCVGPAGSGTPALKAVAVPGMGLSAASGVVSIPALKAGQGAIVRIPSVTAGPEPTSMFRLQLKVPDEGLPRTIIVEGRIGLSRLTEGLSSKSQMFLSPMGDRLISGQPGRSFMIDTNTLHTEGVNTTAGYGLAAADFSPDGAHVAMVVVNPQEKKAGEVIVDSTGGRAEALPAGSRFLRWLAPDQVLLQTSQGLVRHSIAGGEDFNFPIPEGWPSTGLQGNVIPKTGVQFWRSPEGKLVIKKGSEPFQEVLQGVKVQNFVAVAGDLSVFGGVDAERRLWVQHGFNGKPELVAQDVQRAIWGPVSHRAVVQDAKNNTRVYDARDRSWIDLGVVSGVQWSPDEERLLYFDQGSHTLSLITGRTIQPICLLLRLGNVNGVTFSADGTRAFMLAGIEGALDVWELALPPR